MNRDEIDHYAPTKKASGYLLAERSFGVMVVWIAFLVALALILWALVTVFVP